MRARIKTSNSVMENSSYLHQIYADARLLLRIDTVLGKREIDAEKRKEDVQNTSEVAFGWAISIVSFVTVCYLLLEVNWVLSLFDVITDRSTNQDDIKNIEFAGRSLSAFGLTWFFAKNRFIFCKQGIGHFAFDSVLLIAGTIATFYIVGRGYDLLIDSIPKQTSMRLFEASTARKWALDGKLQLNRIDVKDPISLALFPLLILDDHFKDGFHAKFDYERSLGKTEAKDNLLAAYTDIQQTKKISVSLQSKYQDFIKQSMEIEKVTTFAGGAGKKGYVSRLDAINIQKGAATLEKVFVDTYGQPPNAHATFAQFVHGIKNSKFDDLQRAGLAIEKFGGDPQKIKLVDIPGLKITLDQVISMTKNEYEHFIHEQFRTLIAETLPTEATIKKSKIGRDMISAALIPPFALCLSLLSIVINISSIGGHLVAFSLRGSLQSKDRSGIWHLVLPGIAILSIAFFVTGRTPAGFEKAFEAFSQEHPIAAFVVSKVVSIDSFLLRFS